jgi:hypothetical protein
MMPWALLGLFLLFLLVSYIIVQGTRAALAWRDAAKAGDVGVIRDIVEDAIKVWSSQKRPKEVRAEVWRGVQSMLLAEVAPGYVHVSVSAESEFRMDRGEWLELSNPLQEGIAISVKVLELLLYELPHYRPDVCQVDVYTQYRDNAGATHRDCVLSTLASREAARAVDWDEWEAPEILQAFGAHYRLSDNGRPLPVEPLPTPPEYVITEEAKAEAVG